MTAVGRAGGGAAPTKHVFGRAWRAGYEHYREAWEPMEVPGAIPDAESVAEAVGEAISG
jgi:hypothetical protein